MPDHSLVRPANDADIDSVLELLEMRHQEFGLGRYSRDRAASMLQSAVAGTAPVFAGVLAGEGGPEATVGLVLAQFWDTDDTHLEAIWDYVHPEHRGTDHARKLERFAEMAADRLGVELIMGGPIRAGHEGKVRAYCKRLRPAGAFFLYSGPGMQRGSKREREAAANSLIQAFSGDQK